MPTEKKDKAKGTGTDRPAKSRMSTDEVFDIVGMVSCADKSIVSRT